MKGSSSKVLPATPGEDPTYGRSIEAFADALI